MKCSNRVLPILGACTSMGGHRLSLTARKITQMAATGIEYLELSALEPLHLDLFDQERVDEIASAVTDCGLHVWSIHAPFCGFAVDDDDTRADGIRLLVKTVEAAKRFGAQAVVVHPGRDMPSVDRDRELGWIRDALVRVADLADGCVALALETMGVHSLAGPADEMLSVLDGLAPGRVGICLDTGHVHQGADVPAYIRKVGHRIITVHLHDNDGQSDQHNLPGRGSIDWKETLRALVETGYSGVLMCEAGCHNGPLAEAVASFTAGMNVYCHAAFGDSS